MTTLWSRAFCGRATAPQHGRFFIPPEYFRLRSGSAAGREDAVADRAAVKAPLLAPVVRPEALAAALPGLECRHRRGPRVPHVAGHCGSHRRDPVRGRVVAQPQDLERG